MHFQSKIMVTKNVFRLTKNILVILPCHVHTSFLCSAWLDNCCNVGNA